MPKDLLRLDDLTIAFTGDDGEGRTVVDQAGLRIAAGETVALVGESGSGKTQLARSLVGLLPRGARVTGGRLRFGDRVTFDLLDTRQYRDDEAWGDGRRRSCAEHVRPGRTLLGRSQREWLLRGFRERDTRWNVLAQQVLVARLRGPDARGPATWEMDMWDGYPEERRIVLGALADARVPKPVVLTGDIHASWVADLPRDPDRLGTPAVATELAGTSISSGGDGRPMDDRAARLLAGNPHLHFHDGQRGYVRVEVSRHLWRSDFRVVDRVTVPGAPVRTWASWVIEDGRPGAQPG